MDNLLIVALALAYMVSNPTVKFSHIQQKLVMIGMVCESVSRWMNAWCDCYKYTDSDSSVCNDGGGERHERVEKGERKRQFSGYLCVQQVARQLGILMIELGVLWKIRENTKLLEMDGVR